MALTLGFPPWMTTSQLAMPAPSATEISPTLSEADQESFRRLDDDENKALAGAQKWVDDSAALLGLAYLEYEEVKLRYELATKDLASKARITRESEVQRNQVMDQFAKRLKLGPGEWVYDGKDKLVRKDPSNAKST